ncbi:Recombinase [Crinalium epipsammum PCC 9333]|uniref:Recombinase n=1 Tax=Crinalium epipsammum PCC 9333 TaxID=1173022 RepID=K9W3N4_9CYAN|nr:recombinase family protein [Crinalium epipsammum]AFZ14404.1 Recombinase [Crinalium epipsammum PCC 9333]
MRIIAYIYTDPLLESAPDSNIWGWEIDRVYQDLGGRQQLKQLFKDCIAEPADYLLIRRLEDLGDSVAEVCDRISEIESLKIQLVATECEIPQQLQLLQLLQQIQYNQRRDRIRQGHARNRLKAAPPPGKVPYGYKRGKDRYILDRSAAPVVKDFFEQFLLYGSLRGAVRYLEKKYGKKISVSTGQRWLTNPVYRGDTAYQNGDVISDTHVSIISREEAAQIDRLLRRNRSLPPRTASATRSLAGLVVCGECNSPTIVTRVTMTRKKQEYLYLRPHKCPLTPKCRAIPYQEVLQQTIEKICEELPLAVAAINSPNIDGIKQKFNQEIANKQGILDQLPEFIASGILDVETAELRAYKLRTEIAEIKDKLAQLPPVNLQMVAQAVSIQQFWLDLSESERRFYFREFLRQVKVRRVDGLQTQLIFIFD